MKVCMLLCGVLVSLVSSQDHDDGPTTAEQQVCQDLKNQWGYKSLLSAKQKDRCTVTCTFSQYLSNNEQPTSDDVAGVRTQPVVSIIQPKDGNQSIVVVNTGYNHLQPCDQDKVCVRGVCTPVLTNLTAECQENVSEDSIAVQGPNRCLIKCIKLENNSENLKAGYTNQMMRTVNLPLPDMYPCGMNMKCRGRDCLSFSLFSDKC